MNTPVWTRLVELERQVKTLTDFVGRGNYSQVLSSEPHNACFDNLAERFYQLSDELREIGKQVEDHVKSARSHL